MMTKEQIRALDRDFTAPKIPYHPTPEELATQRAEKLAWWRTLSPEQREEESSKAHPADVDAFMHDLRLAELADASPGQRAST
jgi:hypothetical protein